MIAMTQLTVAWAVSAAAMFFLIISAWHNRRSGYQRNRSKYVESRLRWSL